MSKQQSARRPQRSLAVSAADGIDRAEVAKFEALAEEVWDPKGPMRPLHLLNPVRIRYIRDRAAAVLGTADAAALRPFAGLRLADIGCGAGLLAEPMARLGAAVTAIDPSPRSITMALAHARLEELSIDYRATTIEDLAEAGERFDIVLAMEVIEHTPDPDLFIAELADIVRPGGLLVMSTLNRTLRAYALGVLAAERVLRWLPEGTHDWRRFLAPSALARLLRRRGFRVLDTTGVVYRPERGDFLTSADRGVNYLISAIRV